MRSSRFKSIVWLVAFAVIALLAVTTVNAVAHELQHAAHHDAGMHGSGICAWMCATAGVHVVTPVHSTHLFTVAGDASFRSVRLIQVSVVPVSLRDSMSQSPRKQFGEVSRMLWVHSFFQIVGIRGHCDGPCE